MHLFQQGVDRARLPGYVVECLRKNFDIEPAANPGKGEECLQLRCKCNCAVVKTVMQRLDAEPIAGNEQLLIAGIPDGKCPHPVEAQLTVGAPLCISSGDNLGVAIRDKAMAEVRQLPAQFQIVIDLTIVCNPVSPIVIGQGLSSATGKIDDG